MVILPIKCFRECMGREIKKDLEGEMLMGRNEIKK